MPITPDVLNTLLCYACKTPFNIGEEELLCKVPGCGNSFHCECANAAKLTRDEKLDWVCPKCRCNMPRGGDHSGTPVGASKFRATNVTIRKKPTPKSPNELLTTEQLSFPSTEFLEVMAEIGRVRQDMVLIKDMLGQVTSAMVQYDLKLDGLMTQLGNMSRQAQESTKDTPNKPASPQMSYAAAAASPASPPSNTNSNTVACKNPIPLSQPITTGAGITAGNTTDEAIQSSERTSSEKHQTERRFQRPASMRCTGSRTSVSLKAVERRKFVHLWNMVSGLEEVKAYVTELCPTGTCIVEELNSKGNYKSYKIGIPDTHYDKCFSADVWPDNARLKA